MNKSSLAFRIAKKGYHFYRKASHTFYASVRNKVTDLHQAYLCAKFSPCLIIFCDGGICSQIYQYMWGQMLIDEGYPVKYDHTFYEDDGKDMYGNFDRSYVLDKLCYVERLEIAPRFQAEYYRKHYLNPLNQPPYPDNVMNLHHSWQPPQYLGNYYTCDFQEYLPAFQRYVHLRPANEILNGDSYKLYEKITSCESVGVHIRRGDMVQATSAWKAPTVNYFLQAIQCIAPANKEFFFFSDEPDWVKGNILPLLQNVKWNLVECNGSDKGYMDLFLLSNCKYLIGSQGSFGIVAFALNPTPDKLLILPLGSRKNISSRLHNQNVIYFDLNGNRL